MQANTIAIAGDHAGFEMKEALKQHAAKSGLKVEDLGTHDTASVDYPDYAEKLALWLKKNPDAMGVLVCGSGIGISIAANRHRHVRAALCRSGLEARLARNHNDANVLCLGGRISGVETAKDCLDQFLAAKFEGGRHEQRVKKLG